MCFCLALHWNTQKSVNKHSSRSLHQSAFSHRVQMFMFHRLSFTTEKCLQLCAHVWPHLCLHPRPCVWKPRSVSWPGYVCGYLPQWPPWDGCKCVVCVCVWAARGDWPACLFAGPVFSNNALFHGLAVFIDTYSNDDATDVSGGSGSTRQHAVLLHFGLACWQDVLSMHTQLILKYLSL